MKKILQKSKKSVPLFVLFGLFSPFFLFLFLVMLFFYLMNSKHLDDTSLLSNTTFEKSAPKTSLPILGDEDNLLDLEQFKGRVILVNFWGSWCLSCREEHPLLIKIAQDKRFDIIGINYKDSAENAQRFLRKFGNPFKVIGFDSLGHTAIDWGLYGAPETFILNGKNKIIAKHTGPLTWQIYQKKILPTIEKAIAIEELSKNNKPTHEKLHFSLLKDTN